MIRSTDRIRDLPIFMYLLTLTFLLLGCDVFDPDKEVRPETVTIEVTTNTEGPEAAYDSDGYTVLINGEKRKSIGVNDNVSLELKTKIYRLSLGDVAANCPMRPIRHQVDLRDGRGIEVPPFEGRCYSETIVISARHSGDVKVGTIRPDGTDLEWLTDGSQAEISPDGELITFQRDSGIFVIPAEGGEPEQVLSAANWEYVHSPDWGDESKHIYFLGKKGSKEGIFAITPGAEDVWVVRNFTGQFDHFFEEPSYPKYLDLQVSESGNKAALVADFNRSGGASIFEPSLDSDSSFASILSGRVNANRSLSWARQDSVAFVSQRTPDGSRWMISRMTFFENEREKIKQGATPCYAPAAANKTVVYACRGDEKGLWAMSFNGENRRLLTGDFEIRSVSRQ